MQRLDSVRVGEPQVARATRVETVFPIVSEALAAMAAEQDARREEAAAILELCGDEPTAGSVAWLLDHRPGERTKLLLVVPSRERGTELHDQFRLTHASGPIALCMRHSDDRALTVLFDT
jgi:hypothetical protein